jgi:hypothetical protein
VPSRHGEYAIINIDDQGSPGFGAFTVQVVDNGPAGSGDDVVMAFPTGDTTCSRSITSTPDVLISGDAIVHDAPPVPTSKEQCTNGGWRRYDVFKNLGACVSFVATGGSNEPAGPPT